MGLVCIPLRGHTGSRHPQGCVPTARIYVWVVGVAVYLLDAHLGSGIDRRAATMAAPLLLTSVPARCETALHDCGQAH